MGLAQRLAQSFQVREGEGRPILLLTGLSFFMGWSLALYFITSNTVFLEFYKPSDLPLAYVVAGIASFLAWQVLAIVDKRLSITNQLYLKAFIVLASVLFFSLGNLYFPSAELAFGMFIWFRVLAFISVVVFWGLAGRMFDLRQGKRVFGLISTGEVLSDIVGFFSIPIFLKYIGYSQLLFLAAGSLVVFTLLLVVTIRSQREKLKPIPAPVATPTSENKERTRFIDYLKQPYYRYVFILAMVPIFGIMFIDFMFLGQADTQYSDPAVLAQFLSIFYGAVAVVELLLKTFVSGRVITKYGIKLGLLSLPLALLFSTGLAAFSGVIYGATSLFFSFIILSKLLDRSIRSAIYDPAFQILYQPLPADRRIDFQNQIEGVPKALGNTSAGLVLLGLTALGLQSSVWFNLIFLGIVILWTRWTFGMYKEYRGTVRKVMMGGGELEKVRSFLKAGSVFFEDLIFSPVRKKVINTLNLMEKVEPITREDYYRKLLAHPNAKIRGEVLHRIAFHNVTSMAYDVDTVLMEEKNEKVLAVARETRQELQDCRQMTLEQMGELVKSERVRDRVKVANLLGQRIRRSNNRLFIPLLQDNDPAVRTAAILSAGKSKSPELWPYLFESLQDPVYSHAASSAIILIGFPILGDLDNLFNKLESDWKAQYKIMRIIGRIGDKQAIRLLKRKLDYPVDNVRHQVLISLSNMGYQAVNSEFPAIKQAVEHDIGLMVWIMSGIIDLTGEEHCQELRESLKAEIREKIERIFLLLSLMYDSQAMKKVRDIMLNGTREERAFAIEIIDMLVEESIKDLLIPLVEDNSLAEKVRLMRIEFPQEKMPVEERLSEIVNKDMVAINRWTRSCALRAIGNRKNESHRDLLLGNFRHHDFLVRQCAMWAAEQMNPDWVSQFGTRLASSERRLYWREVDQIRQVDSQELIFEKVKMLGDIQVFEDFPEFFLVDLAILANFIRVGSGQELVKDSRSIDMFKVIKGEVGREVAGKNLKGFAEGDLISEMDFGTEEWNGSTFTAKESSGILKVPQEPLFESVANHLFLARCIANYIDNK